MRLMQAEDFNFENFNKSFNENGFYLFKSDGLLESTNVDNFAFNNDTNVQDAIDIEIDWSFTLNEKDKMLVMDLKDRIKKKFFSNLEIDGFSLGYMFDECLDYIKYWHSDYEDFLDADKFDLIAGVVCYFDDSGYISFHPKLNNNKKDRVNYINDDYVTKLRLKRYDILVINHNGKFAHKVTHKGQRRTLILCMYRKIK